MKRLLTLSVFGFAVCTFYACSKINAGPEPEPTSLKIGLIAHLPFDGNADDISDTGLTATVKGTTIVNDRFGNSAGAYYFDGVDDVITYNKPEMLSLGGFEPYTISVWAKPEAVDYTNIMISKFNGGVLAGWYVGVNADSSAQVYRNVGPWAGKTDTKITYGKFNHILTTYDGKNLNIYINGKLESSTPFTSHPYDRKTEIAVGGTHSQNKLISRYLGTIDEIRIYDRVLEAEEIEWLADN
ncbi:LamG domain-containing protein [Jiulongibacter sediminis]|uniref:LamG-like jellyroll fold domain-containing protein n=1 Tax=Jiulongibacter sediminis TaxID=1605367 RepID=A0A0P7BZB3_9BACT|nr:LamG domain-containing protein [Jiulongibacter sediminis]KPM47555.1 hypothetical protein AFM12_13715 [Jiulongibacter sediminis]TBX23349.1 hypothetical protein TK44_13725 [Jiulongibacter sediminis]